MMEVSSQFRGVLLSFLLFLFSSTIILCQAENKITHLEIVGNGECTDCAVNNIHSAKSFAGLHVTIECLSGKKVTGIGKLDKEGKFKVIINLNNGGLKEEDECYAKLKSASKKPCPIHNEAISSKIVFNHESNGKQVFSTSGKLKFSTTTCVSAFLCPPYTYTYPPLPSLPPWPVWKKPLPPLTYYPPVYFPPKVYPPVYLPPKYTKPVPTPQPVVPVYQKPLPPPVPVYKPKPPSPVPVYTPKPPSVPVYTPKPPSVPVYTPKPSAPVYTPKPIPPSIPIYKKPCPPIVIPKYPPNASNP